MRTSRGLARMGVTGRGTFVLLERSEMKLFSDHRTKFYVLIKRFGHEDKSVETG